MSGAWKSAFGQGDNRVNQNTQGPSVIELELANMGRDITREQYNNIKAMQPFQQEMLASALHGLQQQGATDDAINQAITSAQRGQFAQEDFERAAQMGDIQGQLAGMNVDLLRGGGIASPDQIAAIQMATDESIAAGSRDIDVGTQRGIGLIADEVANSRGLRLTDTPILREATLLARSGADQKANLVSSMRANAANQALQYPLQAAGVLSGINLSQQGAAQAATQFQQQLQQQAAQNRLAMYGTAGNMGVGLANVGSGIGASMMSSMGDVRKANISGYGFNPAQNMQGGGAYLSGAGNLMQGIGSMASDRHLKTDIERIGELPSGIPIYTFRFVWSDEVHVGVMADEVLPVIPEAVSKHKDGYYMVDYGKLH